MTAKLISVAALLVILITFFIPEAQDKIVFLDVGQGDSILLQDGTAQVLVDGGPGKTVLRRLAEELPWFDKKIDVIISTHPDKDHLEGLLHVIERYKVGLVLLPQMPHTSSLQAEWLKKLEEAVKRKNIAYRFGWRGEKIKAQDLTVQIISPDQAVLDEARSEHKTNDAGIVARVDLHDRSVLLTADTDISVEHELVQTLPKELLDIDILKVGHHGSKTSTSEELLQATTPSLAAISVGSKNSYGHPTAVVLDRLRGVSKVLRTDQSGSIRFIYSDQNWLLSCAKACIK